MAGKHVASAVKHVPAPLPVKAGIKGAEMVRGKHAAATSSRHAAPDKAYTGRERLRGRNSDVESANPLNRIRSSPGGPGGPAKYKGKNSLVTPRASRTHYIRYIGNQDANNTGKLIGEWVFGLVTICIAVPSQAANAGYQKTMTAVMYRLTALTAVFFVLALLSNTKGGKTAVYAGLLIDLGILFDAVQSGTLQGAVHIATGTSTLVGGHTAPAADITANPPDNPSGGGMLVGGTAGAGAGGGTIPNQTVPA